MGAGIKKVIHVLAYTQGTARGRVVKRFKARGKSLVVRPGRGPVQNVLVAQHGAGEGQTSRRGRTALDRGFFMFPALTRKICLRQPGE